MKPIDYLYDLIGQSNFTTFGYSFKNEKIKDELISKFPIFRIRELSSFSFKNIKGQIKQQIRESRIDSIFNGNEIKIPNFEYLVIDIEDIPSNKNDDDGSSLAWLSIHRSNQIKNILENLRIDSMENNYKVIFTTPINKKLDENPVNQLIGGHSSLYVSDLALVLDDDCKIIKNRFGNDNETISLNGL